MSSFRRFKYILLIILIIGLSVIMIAFDITVYSMPNFVTKNEEYINAPQSFEETIEKEKVHILLCFKPERQSSHLCIDKFNHSQWKWDKSESIIFPHFGRRKHWFIPAWIHSIFPKFAHTNLVRIQINSAKHRMHRILQFSLAIFHRDSK